MKTYHIDQVSSVLSEPEVLYAVRENRIDTAWIAALKALSGLKDEILATSLNLNIKTFRSYKTSVSAMKPHLQEHVLALLSLYKHGIEVFGEHQKFNEWLSKSNYFFDNDKPVHFLTTISGIKFTDDRLTAMQYGDNV